MKSLRTLSLLMEGLLLIMIFVLVLGLMSSVTQQVVNETTLSLEESIVNLDASVALYLRNRRDAFTQASSAIDEDTAVFVLPSFSDLYVTSDDLIVQRILQQDDQSLIFPGFDHSYSRIGTYLESHPNETFIMSPILQSPEFDYPSIYFVERKDSEILFGRLSLEELSGLLGITARNLNGIIVVSSHEGYILSSTSVDLPFHVMPDPTVEEHNEYWITRYDSESLDSELILLKPTSEVHRIVTAIRGYYPIYIVLFILLLSGKIILHDVLMIRPIRDFVGFITSWSVHDEPERPVNLLLGTREFQALYDEFLSKTISVSKAFEEVDNARRIAIEAEAELKVSEEELQAMNLELEERIELRSQELKQAYEQLVEQEKMASIGALVGGVSHEVNTPVGICVTTTSFLESQYKAFLRKYENGEVKRSDLNQFHKDIEESLKILTSSLQRASELISSFKQVAIEQSIEEISEFSLREQIDLLIISLKHEYKYKRHYFTIECPSDLILNSYQGVYMQIFTNLIMNALIHGLNEMEEGEIKIHVESVGNNVKIVFSDNGKGIPPDIKRRIFEPYYTTNRDGGGSGLGLFIVYSLVTQKLGGAIRCVSEPGQGATFQIEVPRDPVEISETI